MKAVVICALFSQIFFIGNLYHKGAYISLVTVAINSLLLVVTMIHLGKPFFRLIELDNSDENISEESPRREYRPDNYDEEKESYVKEWKKVFRHPLIIKDEEYVLDPELRPNRASSLGIGRRKSGQVELAENSGISGNKRSFVGNY